MSSSGERKCIACKKFILARNWKRHMQSEIKRINKLCTQNALEELQGMVEVDTGKRAAAKRARDRVSSQVREMRGKGGGAPLAKVNPKDAHNVDNASKILRRFREKRIIREGRQGAGKPLPADVAPPPMSVCPMCSEVLHGGSDAVNAHIDLCLTRAGNGGGASVGAYPPPSTAVAPPTGPVDPYQPPEDPFAVYSLGGQERIRACSLLDGGYAQLSGSHHRRGDTDSEGEILSIDIEGDEDGGVYGATQFTEDSLVHMAESAGDGDDAEHTSGKDDRARIGRSSDVEVDDVSVASAHITTTGSSANEFILNALRDRVQQQEELVKKVPRCLVCLEPYKDPLTSVNCWHVHCEECWLKTLGTKRLCPQCDNITAPGDLRRIYLT